MAQSKVTRIALESEKMKKDLLWLKRTAESSYGPLGRAALFQPSSGGHVTVTCRSEKIFQMLRTDNPVVKTILASVQAHSQKYKDAGLFTVLLTVNLILSGMELDLPRHKTAVVTSHALSLVAEHMRSDGCPCKRVLDLSSVQHMMSVVKSFLCSKSAVCSLSDLELSHVSSLILQGFLHVIPTDSTNSSFSMKERVHIRSVLGKSATTSKLIHGLLIDSTNPEKSSKYCLSQSCASGPSAKSQCTSDCRVKRNSEGLILTALFDVSMAGDLPEEYPRELLLTADSTAVCSGKGTVEAVAVKQLLALAERLVQEGVGFLGCQKCLHQKVQEYLEDQGVVVVDRLSTFHIGSVKDVTGGQLISSFSLQYPPTWLGKLRNIRQTAIEGKSYLVLEGSSAHSSIVLCCNSETVADELKPLCSAAVSLLEQSLHYSHTFCGGGCTETVLSNFLEKEANEVSEEVLHRLQCNKRTYSSVLRNAASTFAALATSLEHFGGLTVTDSVYRHCWSFPPHDYCEAAFADSGMSGEVLASFEGKTCCCGAVKLSDLQACCSCEWRTLHRRGFSPIPEAIQGLLKLKRRAQSRDGLRCETDSNDTLVSSNSAVRGSISSPVEANFHGIGSSTKLCCTFEQSPGEATHIDTADLGTPAVCEAFLPKLKAVELASDLVCTVLRIAYVVSERNIS